MWRRARVAEAGEILTRGTSVGRYTILDALGQGGMGHVYAAYDPELDRKVAVKLLRRGFGAWEGARTRLLREAQAMARVSHPNVVTVHDVGTYRGQVFLAMELVKGATAREWLDERRRTWREVLEVFLSAGRGLAAAHAEGLVHRDFKPSNVLIGDDGRVRVSDFGLVRTRSDGSPVHPAPIQEAPAGHTVNLHIPLTELGAVMGTPKYMAPEQQLARPVDARADQFSFSIAVYEALYNEPPFGDATNAERLERIQRGEIRPPPRDARVPPHLRRTLQRGLRADPGDRWPSMDALLAELGRDLWVVRRRGVAAVGLVAVAAVAVVGFRAMKGQGELLCKGAERKLAGVWDADVARTVGRAFGATGAPNAAAAAQGVSQVLDTWAGGWLAMHVEACEATRRHGEQPESVLSLRMQCLDRRLAEVRALTTIFTSADPTVVSRAVGAAQGLTPWDGCADIAALTAPAPIGDDPVKRLRVAEIYERLAQVRALDRLGKWNQALALARTLADEAAAVGYGPAEAEAWKSLAYEEDGAGAYEDAVRHNMKAIETAIAANADEVVADAWIELMWVQGFRLFDVKASDLAMRVAAAYLERLGPVRNRRLEASFHYKSAAIAELMGKPEEMVTHLERAIAIRQAEGPPSALISSYDTLGRAYRHLGELEKSRAAFEASISHGVNAYGWEHPKLGVALFNESLTLMDMGRLDEARQAAEKSLGILERTVGAQGTVAFAWDALGQVLAAEGKHAEAISHFERALSILTKPGQSEAPFAAIHTHLGLSLISAGNRARGVTVLEHALQAFAGVPVDKPDIAKTQLGLARALENRDRKRAVELATKARDAFAELGQDKARVDAEGWLAALR